MSDGRLPITQHYYHIYTAQIRQIVNKGILVCSSYGDYEVK